MSSSSTECVNVDGRALRKMKSKVHRQRPSNYHGSCFLKFCQEVKRNLQVDVRERRERSMIQVTLGLNIPQKVDVI